MGFRRLFSALPKDHWLYERDETRPVPAFDHSIDNTVRAAARDAIKRTTYNGQLMDFDPDAMVQNFVIALCGYYDKG